MESQYLKNRRDKMLGVVSKTSLEAVLKPVKPLKKKSDNVLPKLLEAAQNSFNAFIRGRDKGKKCFCGKPGQECGHLYPMNYSGVRFDEENCHLICKNCNNYCNAAIDPNYKEYVKGLLGNRFKWLQKRANETKLKKWGREELSEIIEEYKFKLKAIKNQSK
jgi:hypothetical protein